MPAAHVGVPRQAHTCAVEQGEELRKSHRRGGLLHRVLPAAHGRARASRGHQHPLRPVGHGHLPGAGVRLGRDAQEHGQPLHGPRLQVLHLQHVLHAEVPSGCGQEHPVGPPGPEARLREQEGRDAAGLCVAPAGAGLGRHGASGQGVPALPAAAGALQGRLRRWPGQLPRAQGARGTDQDWPQRADLGRATDKGGERAAGVHRGRGGHPDQVRAAHTSELPKEAEASNRARDREPEGQQPPGGQGARGRDRQPVPTRGRRQRGRGPGEVYRPRGYGD
mmetsp:Transcript_25846/g.80627  ORF Transcript_25846/g.80627 Transcript_25846/m.80627 type:complete len:278 (+) Transcript_25846:583-1416(+)